MLYLSSPNRAERKRARHKKLPWAAVYVFNGHIVIKRKNYDERKYKQKRNSKNENILLKLWGCFQSPIFSPHFEDLKQWTINFSRLENCAFFAKTETNTRERLFFFLFRLLGSMAIFEKKSATVTIVFVCFFCCFFCFCFVFVNVLQIFGKPKQRQIAKTKFSHFIGDSESRQQILQELLIKKNRRKHGEWPNFVRMFSWVDPYLYFII